MLRNIATIMVRPRTTMRRILDAGRDRMVLPLVVLALLSGYISDFNGSELQRLVALHGSKIVAVIAGATILVTIIMVVLFFGVSWIAWMIGRFLEGKGTAREVRSAMAWGLTPFVWALLYAVPVALFYPAAKTGGIMLGDGRWRLTQGAGGCGWLLLIGLLDLAIVIWAVVITSHTIGEAHRFSSLRGFGTLCLLLALPAVITLAAALTMFFSQ